MKPTKNKLGRSFNIILVCFVAITLSGYLIMFFGFMFEYFLNGKVTNIKHDVILYTKMIIMASVVSGVGCCFLKDDEFKKK